MRRLHPSHSEYLTIAVFVEVTRGDSGHGRGHCMKATPATRPHRRFCGENIRTVNGTPANLTMLIEGLGLSPYWKGCPSYLSRHYTKRVIEWVDWLWDSCLTICRSKDLKSAMIKGKTESPVSPATAPTLAAAGWHLARFSRIPGKSYPHHHLRVWRHNYLGKLPCPLELETNLGEVY